MNHSPSADRFRPGTMVRVTQQIPQRDEVWTTTVRGQVVDYEQARTGSWYAHAKNRRYWLDRLTIKADDGSITELILDDYTHIEVLEDTAAR